jgi:hypothetical protein
MKLQSVRITEQTAEGAVLEMLLAEAVDTEDSGEFLKFRLSIPSAPVPRVAELQIVALRRVRELVSEHIQRLQSLLSQHHVDIPQ